MRYNVWKVHSFDLNFMKITFLPDIYLLNFANMELISSYPSSPGLSVQMKSHTSKHDTTLNVNRLSLGSHTH